MLLGWKRAFVPRLCCVEAEICGLQLRILEKEFMWDQFKKFLKLSFLAPRWVCPSREHKALALFWLCLTVARRIAACLMTQQVPESLDPEHPQMVQLCEWVCHSLVAILHLGLS